MRSVSSREILHTEAKESMWEILFRRDIRQINAYIFI